MPIPRRISQTALEAQTQSSGVFRSSGEFAAVDRNLDELEEVFDDDDLPDLPSLMPGSGPKGYRSMEMEPIRPPKAAPAAPAAGFLLDSGFMEDDLDIPLDLQALPSRGGIQTMAGVEVTVPLSGPVTGAPSRTYSTGKMAAFNPRPEIDPLPGIVAFAGFGIPPEGFSGTPSYALRVIARKWTLRDDLRIARLRRLPDVGLYEAALRVADETAVTKGIAVIAFTVAGAVGAFAAAIALLF